MRQRADDDKHDHPKDLADLVDAVQRVLSRKRKNVWTWLRLAVFFGSIVTNVGFWRIYTKHNEDQVRIADYNDRSWAAYASFDEFDRKLEAAQQKDIDELKLNLLLWKGAERPGLFEPVKSLDAEWIGAMSPKLTELHLPRTVPRAVVRSELLISQRRK